MDNFNAGSSSLCVIVCCCVQICLQCRQRGHTLKRCPNKGDETLDKKICYNCGEKGHSLFDCTLPLQDGTDFSLVLPFFFLQFYVNLTSCLVSVSLTHPF